MPLILFAAERTAGDKHKWINTLGTIHHFPNQYLPKFKSGERFIYYQGVRRAGGKRGEPGYFGAGIIGGTWPDDERNDEAKHKRNWAWYCALHDYAPFEAQVPRQVDGVFFEDLHDNQWGVGVRSISDEAFDRILEAAGIFSVPNAVSKAAATPSTQFVAKLMKPPKGPPPVVGQRVLSADSGPAATYWFELSGSAAQHVVGHLLTGPNDRVFKVGFSKHPKLRLEQVNSYLPCPETLCWQPVKEQWHEDEINAYAMEQKVFDLLVSSGVDWWSGELFVASAERVELCWQEARATAERPTDTVAVPA